MEHVCERITFYLAQAGALEALAERSSTVEAKAELLGLSVQYRQLAADLKQRRTRFYH